MKKTVMIAIALLTAGLARAGSVGLPTEHIAIPQVAGDATVKVWDMEAQKWIFSKTEKQPARFEFPVPAWNKWYWVGVWDNAAGKYVLGQWVGHHLTD